MKLKFSEWLLYLLGWANWIVAFVLEWLDKLQVDRLQKIFLLLSINLLVIATIKYLFGWKFGPAERTQSAAKTVSLADDPNAKAKFVMNTINKSKGGLHKMFVKLFETLQKMSKKQWVSLILLIVGVLLGISSQYYPDVPFLHFIDNNLGEWMAAIGLTAAPGIISAGKALSDAYVIRKNAKSKLKKLKAEKALCESDKIDLNNEYAQIIKVKSRVDSSGGGLTADQKIIYDTYLGALNDIESKLKAINEQIEDQNKIIEDSIKSTFEVVKEALDDD
ncbi:MAG: hypothetical protein AB7E61_06380 [Acholeplasmataceae bacterium]